MSRQVKKLYKVLAWIFTVLIASGTLLGCRKPIPTEYGPQPEGAKYGPPTISRSNHVDHGV